MIFLIIFAALLLAVSVCLVLAYRKAYYSSPNRIENPHDMPKNVENSPQGRPMHELISQMEAIEWEDVYIKSHDGLTLHARYLHLSDGAPVHVQMHGYRGTAFRDFCGGNELVRKMGHNSLVIDQRAMGKSEGNTISFGVNERYDLVSWINYVNDRFGKDTPVMVYGVSMGAATVIMGAGIGLPENVLGAVADSPYSSPREIIQKVCGDIGLPRKAGYAFARLSAKIIGRFDPDAASCIEAVKKTRIPILVVHGESDSFVPCDMSRRIKAANPDMVQLETFEGADHGLSYVVDTPRYQKTVREFMNRCFERGRIS